MVVLKIVKVGNYSPSQYDKVKGDLIVPFYCVDENRNHVTIKVTGTQPRFWAEGNPLDMNWKEVETTTVAEGFVDTLKEQGWTVNGIENGEYVMTRINSGIAEKIVDVRDEGFTTFGTGTKCWTVFVKYPFDVPSIRDALHEKKVRTNAADVKYNNAVRMFYGLKTPFIEIPDEMLTVDIKQVRCIEDAKI
jgi:hypothetical protein